MDSTPPSSSSTSPRPRHSFARELFRFNNTTHHHASLQQQQQQQDASTEERMRRIGSADGGPSAPYGVIRHRAGTRGAIPMRKAKTQQSYTSAASSSSAPTSALARVRVTMPSLPLFRKRNSDGPQDYASAAGGVGETEGARSRRASRLNALLSPQHGGAGAVLARLDGPSDAAPQAQGSVSEVSVHSTSTPAPPRSSLVSIRGSDAVVELPPGTRVGKTARANVKQLLQAERAGSHHGAGGKTDARGSRRSSLPSSTFGGSRDTTSNTTGSASARHQPVASPQYPIPLPPGQKARTVLVGISPPPTAALDGSLAMFEHVRKYVLREGEEAILHTVLPESQARRKVMTPQDLIELTAELEREDEQYLEMQSACMNFLTLLAVELETSQRFVKIHVTQAQPPDGGSAAQARSRSRSHSRSASSSRAGSRPSSSAGIVGTFGSLVNHIGGGNASVDGTTERGRSRQCARLKAREDEAIANELSRVAREYDVDLIVIGQPGLGADTSAPGTPHVGQGRPRRGSGQSRVRSLSRSRSRSRSRPASRAHSPTRNAITTQSAKERRPSGADVGMMGLSLGLHHSSRRGSLASKGSSGGGGGIGPHGPRLDRRNSIPEDHIAPSTTWGASTSSSAAQIFTASNLPQRLPRSDSGYTSFSGSASERAAHSAGAGLEQEEGTLPTSTLSADWNFGADSFSAQSPARPPAGKAVLAGAGMDAAPSPRSRVVRLPDEGGPSNDGGHEHGDGAAGTAPRGSSNDPVVLVNLSRSSAVLADLAEAARSHATERGQGAEVPKGDSLLPDSTPPQPFAYPSLLSEGDANTGTATATGTGTSTSRRASRVIIADEPPDSPLRQRDRERAARARGETHETLELGGGSAEGRAAMGSGSGSGSSSAPPSRRGSLAPDASELVDTGNGVLESNSSSSGRRPRSSLTTMGSSPGPPSHEQGSSSLGGIDGGTGSGGGAGGGGGGGGGGTSKRLSKLLGKLSLPSPSSTKTHALNGLATELVRRSPVPVLVVNEDVLAAYS